jgi:hypothetical protein
MVRRRRAKIPGPEAFRKIDVEFQVDAEKDICEFESSMPSSQSVSNRDVPHRRLAASGPPQIESSVGLPVTGGREQQNTSMAWSWLPM